MLLVQPCQSNRVTKRRGTTGFPFLVTISTIQVSLDHTHVRAIAYSVGKDGVTKLWTCASVDNCTTQHKMCSSFSMTLS